MHNQGDSLADKPSLEYFVVSRQFDGLWSVDHQEYWARNCNFEMHMRTNRRLAKTFAGWHNVKVFALPSHDRPGVYVSVPGWWVGWESSLSLLVPSPSVFVYYSGLMLCGSKADKVQIWRILIT